MKKPLSTAGATVTLQANNAKNSTIRLHTTYSMNDETLAAIQSELKMAATRKRTQPQMNRHGGFCSHIQRDKATLTARRVMYLASLEKRSLDIDRIKIPSPELVH